MKTLLLPTLISSIFILSACSSGSTPNAAARDTYTLKGTVPGTVIEAFCDNGAYYKVSSTQNGTSKHPFELTLPANLVCHLVMTTNEGTANEIITPIGFQDTNSQISTQFTASKDKTVDMGHISLYLDPANASAFDLDNDHVIDSPKDIGYVTDLTIRDKQKSTLDPDNNGIVEPYDDEDNDGVLNKNDADYSNKAEDSDRDGLPDSIDINKTNDVDSANEYPKTLDSDNDGYLDEDKNHDGYYDDDSNKDGYHDDDKDNDGYHDDDKDHNGLHD